MDAYASLTAIVAGKLGEIKATQEVILKAQATFLAAVKEEDWKPIFDDLRAQAQEAAQVYREQILAEMLLLAQQKNPPAP